MYVHNRVAVQVVENRDAIFHVLYYFGNINFIQFRKRIQAQILQYPKLIWFPNNICNCRRP